MVRIVVMLSLLLVPFSLFSKEFVIGLNERDIYRHKDEEGNWAGKDIKLIEAVFRRTPYQYRIVSMPWARVIKDLKKGDIDMTVAATALPERKEFAYFTKNNFRYSHHMLFVNKAKLNLFESVKQLSDLAEVDVVIAALRGAIFYESYPVLLQNKQFARRITYISEEQNMSSFVLKGRADGYIDSELEGKYYLLSQPEYNKKIIPLFRITSDEDAGSKLMFSKKRVSTEQVKVFDNALKALHKSGEYEEISRLFDIDKNE
ncbi:amino acid ABC transporter substrate-binding protein [Thalassotalea sp. M1531]|uniref:Amino acid ABC transporter substrate-binding protein n=1 Tax=Thalassotalea algicola TaxID=2716224 RepID=A0A7Y0LE15_9GAMM|nr:transporter substrate-binding domain-containing protein [Thalassotalea algicola]NMP32726.1 amino acid ABC transporter substrate-binding protein [Thalassotalea algicola]